MKKTLNRIGFKFTWENNQQTEIEPIHEVINNQQELPTAFTELANRIDNVKTFMTTTAYTKMRKAERLNIVNQYDFYLSLFNEYTLKTANQ
jgi:hypothetical protein